jgi:hypothetical protein
MNNGIGALMKGVTCVCCNQVCGDTETVSCLESRIEIDGYICIRSKYDLVGENERCYDCGIRFGGIHHYGCHVEQCPECLDRLITCHCSQTYLTSRKNRSGKNIYAYVGECGNCGSTLTLKRHKELKVDDISPASDQPKVDKNPYGIGPGYE